MNTDAPKVSVCMITYNHEAYIVEAIEGVLMQQCDFEIELIIANDASSDKTHSIINEIITKPPKGVKVKYFNHPKNLGMMPNFIFALQQCQGQYIALCEGDDYWTAPLKLQKQVDFLEQNIEYNICFHKAKILINNKLQLHDMPKALDYENIHYSDLLKYYNFITTASVMLRIPEEFKLPVWFYKVPWGDLGLYRILIMEGKIKCLPDIMSVYRMNDQGIYTKLNKTEQNLLTLRFYKMIKVLINQEELNVLNEKKKKLKYQISKTKYPNNIFLYYLSRFYLHIKY